MQLLVQTCTTSTWTSPAFLPCCHPVPELKSCHFDSTVDCKRKKVNISRYGVRNWNIALRVGAELYQKYFIEKFE